jgi:hypothetical protein
MVFRGSNAFSRRRASTRNYPIPLIRLLKPTLQLGKFGFRPLDYDLRPAARDSPALAVD